MEEFVAILAIVVSTICGVVSVLLWFVPSDSGLARSVDYVLRRLGRLNSRAHRHVH